MKNRIAFRRPKAFSLAASFLFILVNIFCIQEISLASEKILINEIQITGGTGKTSHDFIELHNPGPADYDLSGHSLVKRTSSGTSDSKIISWEEEALIPSSGFYVWANENGGFSESVPADISSTSTISDNNGVALKAPDGKIIDSVGWGSCKNAFVEKNPFPQNPGANKSIGRLLSKDTGDNSADFFLFDITSPGDINHKEDEEEIVENHEDVSAPNYSSDIRLNEILPNPEGDEKKGEYIEIYNDGDSPVNLAKWALKDSSKTSFVFPTGHTIASGGYLTLYRDTFKFALNNTGNEEVFLLDPDGNIVSQAQYENAKENVSFSFDGSAWHWSKYLTPNKPNRFGNSSKIKAEEVKKGYVGVPIEFSLDPEHANFSKITWDFGDKKKSYLKNPVHTYLKKGKYEVRVSASGETEDISDSFTLRIEDYPREKVEIVALLPNPYGPDIGQEWIAIRNNGKDVVNLKGWKLASGQATLINHPVRNDLEILPGEISQLTRENAFFTLNNKAMNIELRYPDGKPADKVSYAKEKIGDDEIYSKEDLGWIWISSEEANEEIAVYLDESEQKVLSATDVISDDVYPEGNLSDLGKFSISEEWKEKKKNRAKYLSYGLHIELASDFSEKIALGYFSRRNLPIPEKTEFFLEINAFLNKLLFN